MTKPLRVCVIYEDNHRSKKLLKHVGELVESLGWQSIVEIGECDLNDYNNCIVALPSSAGRYADSPHAILSRFSGSAFYRGNAALQDISLYCCAELTVMTRWC